MARKDKLFNEGWVELVCRKIMIRQHGFNSKEEMTGYEGRELQETVCGCNTCWPCRYLKKSVTKAHCSLKSRVEERVKSSFHVSCKTHCWMSSIRCLNSRWVWISLRFRNQAVY